MFWQWTDIVHRLSGVLLYLRIGSLSFDGTRDSVIPGRSSMDLRVTCIGLENFQYDLLHATLSKTSDTGMIGV